MWSAFYQSVAHRFSALDWWHFMNYGCADLAGDRAPIALRNEDEDERYCIQLYDHVASAVDLRNCDVLEVGCGRGGGASYIARYLHPKSMVGVDIAGSAIQFCRRAHRSEGLRFLKGDAENLPFADQSFDVVINIESSFCYGDMARFLSEVGRVLRPGGSFLLADLRLAHEVEGLLADLRASPLEILETKDITAEVGHALAFDHERRVKGMNGKIPFLLRGVVNTFAGVQGTRIPNLLSSGELVYLNVVLRKSPGREEDAQPPDDACRSLPWEGRNVPAAFAQGEARSATARSPFFF
ncbi:MAG: methyltransferase domain-containing protein [Alphaproteobacteria bacterium]